MATPAPVLFLSHGAPPLADDARWTGELARWGAALPRPRAILVISAHWEAAPITLSASAAPTELVYDFWGFAPKYYDVRYDAPVAPELAASVERLLAGHHPVRREESRGLDHGAYVPLVELFPAADVPVLQMSMPTLSPPQLFEIGRRLAPLRDEGVLIVGSGFTTHNLSWHHPHLGPDTQAPRASSEFDDWAARAVAGADVDTLLDALHRAPAFGEAHPRSEHWAPLYLSLGAALRDGSSYDVETTVDGFWYGLSKRSWQFA